MIPQTKPCHHDHEQNPFFVALAKQSRTTAAAIASCTRCVGCSSLLQKYWSQGIPHLGSKRSQGCVGGSASYFKSTTTLSSPSHLFILLPDYNPNNSSSYSESPSSVPSPRAPSSNSSTTHPHQTAPRSHPHSAPRTPPSSPSPPH
jgi:hypothetical protein